MFLKGPPLFSNFPNHHIGYPCLFSGDVIIFILDGFFSFDFLQVALENGASAARVLPKSGSARSSKRLAKAAVPSNYTRDPMSWETMGIARGQKHVGRRRLCMYMHYIQIISYTRILYLIYLHIALVIYIGFYYTHIYSYTVDAYRFYI